MAVTILVIAVLAAASYGVYSFSNKEEMAETVQNAVPVATEQDAKTLVSISLYKNGEYNVVGNYNSPGGPETMGIKLTLKDDVITDVSIEPQSDRPISQKFQVMFKDNVKPLVIGKKIDEVQLDKVSGSSLTPKGFNDAVEKVKSEAKA